MPRPFLRRLGHRIVYPVTLVFSRAGLLAAVYYAFVSSAFWREMRAVLAGRARYLQLVLAGRSNRFLLIRNTHRLEKGLLMRPARDLFALEYIEETVRAFEIAVADGKPADDGAQLGWSNDVLTAYFDAVDGSHPLVRSLAERFRKVALAAGAECRVPYHRRAEAGSQPVAFDDFVALSRHRKSVRWFVDRPVPHDLMRRALAAASLAPSACNRQPYEFLFFDDPGRIATLSTLPMGTKGWSGNIPMFAVIVGDLSAYFSERDRHAIYIDASLAAMSFMLALETLGLSSCPINWPDVGWRERRMSDALGLRPWQRPVLCMAIGYADPEGLVAYSGKRSLDQIARFDG
jgi:nitroreductase